MPSRPEPYDLGSNIPYTYNIGDNTYHFDPLLYSSSATSVPIVIPAMLPTVVTRQVEKKDDSPSAWLREQIDEICELAFAT